MSTKDRALPYIDAQTTSLTQSPDVRKVRFNPYTGGIISTGSDKPTFGKYTMEVRSGSAFDSRVVRFRKKLTGSTWSELVTEIPIPQVKLLVHNPNYEIVDSIVFLALAESALDGVDNGGAFDQSERQENPGDYYISFSPEKNTPIIKRTVTLELYDDIVRLFQKYTIYELLELMTGADYTAITDNSTLIKELQDNFSSLRLYAEAGFNNDSDSTADGYFIRNKIAARFTFDKAYLGNPKLTGILVKTDSNSINVTMQCEGLRRVDISVYAGNNTAFDYDAETPVKKYSVDVAKKVNPVLTIPITDIPAPKYNSLTDFTTNAQLDSIINSRKVFAVKVTKVTVSSGIEKQESTFTDFFKINPAVATTKVVSFNYNLPAPTLATSLFATKVPRAPYFLNLTNNSRIFYFRIEDPAGCGFDPKKPSTVRGILFKYLNNPNVAENSMRFYALNDTTRVALMQDGFVPTGTTTVHYYYKITDFFSTNESPYPSYELDVPSVSTSILVYSVNNYYFPSLTPLKLASVKYDLQNYFTLPGNVFFSIDKAFKIQYNPGFLVTAPRLTLRFNIEYVRAKSATETSPGVGAVWTALPGTYKFAYTHNYEAIFNQKAITVNVYSPDETGSTGPIDLKAAFSNVKVGQAVWFRFNVVGLYTTDKPLPYTGKILGTLKKVV